MRTFLFSLIAFVIFIPVAAFAQQNLVNLPIGETGNFNDYINAVYLMFISIAALIAVIKIIIAGVKYMFSDIVTQKSEAKRDIQGALLGLLVVLAAVVVLSIINPDLTTFDPDITGIERRDPIAQNTSSPAAEAINTINQINANGGRPIAMASASASNITACENINQPECDSQGSASVHCYQGEVVELANSQAICSVSQTNNIRQDETLICDQTQTNPGDSCRETGTCGQYTYDCSAAESRCEAAGYDSVPDTNWLGQAVDNRVNCVNPDPGLEIFICSPLGPGQFDCTAATAQCTGDRTATQTGAGEVTCQ